MIDELSMRIQIQNFTSLRIQIRIQGFDDKTLKISLLKQIQFFSSKLQFIYPYASKKDVQATGEEFLHFFYFCGPFFPPAPHHWQRHYTGDSSLP
jgi:hypothetical protein